MSKVLILDFGSQYTQLIARRIREKHVYCEIHPCTWQLDSIKAFNPDAIILSGGPASVLSKNAPTIDVRLLRMGKPILGICYGMQLMAHLLGGRIHRSQQREYGKSILRIETPQCPIFKGMAHQSIAWMSHGDSVNKLPKGFRSLARTENHVCAAMGMVSAKLYGLQFHPEVAHTEQGATILANFLFTISRLKRDWSMQSFIHQSVKQIKNKVSKNKVILGLSGGVDSAVAALLIHRAIKDQLTCVFINNGLLRLGEANEVRRLFERQYHLKLRYVDASRIFLKRLRLVANPEKKRKIIGRTFIEIFNGEARKIKGAKFLAQGTLYPDVIESQSFKGPSAVIKSHHNVGGLPKRMGLQLLEPFRELFKDEVREVGRVLKIPSEIIARHPFPGPGLAVRILGSVTDERLHLLRQADKIVVEEVKRAGLYHRVWQAFAVLLPIKSVGVMGDERTYEATCAIRVVQSQDGMTANSVNIPHSLLELLSNRIINEVKGINRVVYDITSKPPGTIEWE